MTETAIHYGDALYDLALEEQQTGEYLTQLDGVWTLFSQNPDYIRLLAEPSVPKQERCRIIDEALRGRIRPYLLNFLKLLCENGLIRQTGDCLSRFRGRYNEDNGILEAVAVTAVPMPDALREKLRARLAETTGKQIDLRVKTDPSLLGGIRLETDGLQLDGTVRSRLDGLRRALSEAVL